MYRAVPGGGTGSNWGWLGEQPRIGRRPSRIHRHDATRRSVNTVGYAAGSRNIGHGPENGQPHSGDRSAGRSAKAWEPPITLAPASVGPGTKKRGRVLGRVQELQAAYAKCRGFRQGPSIPEAGRKTWRSRPATNRRKDRRRRLGVQLHHRGPKRRTRPSPPNPRHETNSTNRRGPYARPRGIGPRRCRGSARTKTVPGPGCTRSVILCRTMIATPATGRLAEPAGRCTSAAMMHAPTDIKMDAPARFSARSRTLNVHLTRNHGSAPGTPATNSASADTATRRGRRVGQRRQPYR